MLTNQVPTGGTTPLFTTSARVDAAPLIEGRIGLRLGRNVWVEGGASYARPDFAVDLAGDVEDAPDVTAISMLTQVTIDGSLQYRWTRPGRRMAPFVMGGRGLPAATRRHARNGGDRVAGAGWRRRARALVDPARLPAAPRDPWRRACGLAAGCHRAERAAWRHVHGVSGNDAAPWRRRPARAVGQDEPRPGDGQPDCENVRESNASVRAARAGAPDPFSDLPDAQEDLGRQLIELLVGQSFAPRWPCDRTRDWRARGRCRR